MGSCGVPAACDHPATACERCGALVAVLVLRSTNWPFLLGSPASLGDSVLCPLFFGRDYTSLRRRKEAWFGAPVQRRALAHLVLLIFDAAPGAGYLALCIK